MDCVKKKKRIGDNVVCHMCPPGGGVADEERLPGLHGDGVREKPRWKH